VTFATPTILAGDRDAAFFGQEAVGTVSVDVQATHLQFGEFYILRPYRGQGLGTTVLAQTLQLADDRHLEHGSSTSSGIQSLPCTLGTVFASSEKMRSTTSWSVHHVRPNPAVKRTNTGGADLSASLALRAPLFAAYLRR
jgi:GNAT superfamily N-acetyltransferase